MPLPHRQQVPVRPTEGITPYARHWFGKGHYFDDPSA